MTDQLAARAFDVPPARAGGRIDRVRNRKLRQLRLKGYDPFPEVRLPSRLLAAEVYALHDPRELAPGEHSAWRHTVAGRLVGRRKHRHATFIDLRDQSGVIELCAKPDRLEDAQCAQLRDADMGDIICVEGTVYVTDNRQLTLSITSSQLLAKALRSPPVRQSAPRDGGQRALALLADETARDILKARSTLTGAIREWMAAHEFVAVEAPTLQPLADAADCRSLTVASADAPGWSAALRASSRSYLRRCLVGGFERVYELGRCFAADRAGARAPERTMLEWAVAYTDHTEAARQAEELILHAAASVDSRLRAPSHERAIDLSGPWRTMTVREGIEERCRLDILTADTCELARRCSSRAGGEGDGDNWDSLVNALYEDLVEPELIAPTIVFDFPLSAHALARRHPVHDRLASSFRVVIGGVEVARGDSELNDPHEQWQRLDAPGKGARTPAPRDEEVRLLEYGLCPAASAQLHVDRLLGMLGEGGSVRGAVTPRHRPPLAG